MKVDWFQPANHMLGGGAYHALGLWGFHGNTCQSSSLGVPSPAEIEIEDRFFLQVPADNKACVKAGEMGWSEKEELVLTDGQQWWRWHESAQSQQVDLFELISK